MTNEQLLDFNGPDKLLTSIEAQRRYVLQRLIRPMACPSCGTPLNQFEALGIAINDYDFNKLREHDGNCTQCKRPLRHVLLFTGGEYWAIDFARENPDKPCGVCAAHGEEVLGKDHRSKGHQFRYDKT